MDINKKIYIFTLIQGISMIILGILTLTESSRTINEGIEYLLIALVFILTVVSTLLGIFTYSFLKRQVKKMEPNTNSKKALQPKHIIYFFMFNLIVLIRLVTLILP